MQSTITSALNQPHRDVSPPRWPTSQYKSGPMTGLLTITGPNLFDLILMKPAQARAGKVDGRT
jgi:hypothetical protein